jgi:hypothetical protein
MDLDSVGVSTVKDSTAFKKIQFFSKIDPTSLFNVKSDFQHTFNKLSNYYSSDLDLNYSYSYGMDRQHNYTSLSTTLPLFSTLLDNNSVNKFLSYNFDNVNSNNQKNNLNINRLSSNSVKDYPVNYNSILPTNLKRLSDVDFSFYLNSPNLLSILNTETDSKQFSNIFKFSLNYKHKKKII